MWSWIIPISPFALAGLYFLVAPWTTLTTIHCDRSQPTRGNCTVYQSALDWRPQRLPLPFVQGVWAESKLSGRSSTTYLFMETPQGRFKSKAFWSGPEAKLAVDQLNAFLATPGQSSVKVVIDQRQMGLVWGSVFLSGIPLIIWLRRQADQDPFQSN